MPLSRRSPIAKRRWKRRRRARILRCESLESRRLLAAEGMLFAFSDAFDTAGIAGDVSATIRWGDGTSSAATSISGGNTSGNVSIRFDYSLDTGGFFSGAGLARRNLLEIAADSIVGRFSDQLVAISPGGIKEWEPSVFHPSIGPANQLSGTLTPLPKNMPVPENEIIIYAGARDLPGSSRGIGGPASYTFPSSQFTCQTQAECDAKVAEIEAFRDTVRGRGQNGALASPQTDIAPHIGSIGFDTETDWYFGVDDDGIQPGQLDFLSVAVHEIAHVLGFGITRDDGTTSWERATATGFFDGPAAAAAYHGSGNPPVEDNHWSNDVLDQAGQATLMSAAIATGQRQLFTPLDFAAMDDLGWELLDTRATVSGEHRFPDDGIYPIDLILSGSGGGEVVHRVNDLEVTNASPTLTVAGNQLATIDQPLSIADIGVMTDPGFRNDLSNPPTSESFNYTIEWDDGAIDEGTATIDAHGDSNGAPTIASFDGSHTYLTPGTHVVTVRVSDDDGGSAQGSFEINVTAPPSLSLELSVAAIGEDEGEGAATLTVRRSGPASGSDQIVDLQSSELSEARLPGTAVIPANATSVSVPVDAINDALLDGNVTVRLSASGGGLQSGHIDLIVRDAEFLTAVFSADQVRENEPDSVNLLIRRSNTDTDTDLAVHISGVDAAQFDLPSTIVIPANQQDLEIPVNAIDDVLAELTQTLTIGFSADGYAGTGATIDLIDDEPPLFQNPILRFDVNNDGVATASDALRVINQLHVRGDVSVLDPQSEQPDGIFLDVSGDYQLSALDALLAINELARQSTQSESVEGESVARPPESRPVVHVPDDDDHDAWWWTFEVGI